jgi:hypothetical protein
MGFEVVEGDIAEAQIPPLSLVIGYIVTDFQTSFGEVAETVPIEQFGFEVAPKRLSVSIIVTVAAAAHGVYEESSSGLAHGQGAA